MKKTATHFLSILILLSFYPKSINASNNIIDYTPQAPISHTLKKNITIFGGYGSFPPAPKQTYFYNDGSYSGTLKYSYMVRERGNGIGDKMYEWYITYSGYVTLNSSK